MFTIKRCFVSQVSVKIELIHTFGQSIEKFKKNTDTENDTNIHKYKTKHTNSMTYTQ